MQKQLIKMSIFIRNALRAPDDTELILTPIIQKESSFIESPFQYSDLRCQSQQKSTPNRKKIQLRDITDKINEINQFISCKNQKEDFPNQKIKQGQVKQNIGKLSKSIKNNGSKSKKNQNFEMLEVVEQEANSISQSSNTKVEICTYQNQNQALRMLLSPTFFQTEVSCDQESGYQYDQKAYILNTQPIICQKQQDNIFSSDEMISTMDLLKREQISKPKIAFPKKASISLLRNSQIPQSRNKIKSTLSTQRSLGSLKSTGSLKTTSKFMSITLKSDSAKAKANRFTSSLKYLHQASKQRSGSTSSRKGIKIISVQKSQNTKQMKEFRQHIQQIRKLKQNLKLKPRSQMPQKYNHKFSKKQFQLQLQLAPRKIITINIKKSQKRDLSHKKVFVQKHSKIFLANLEDKYCQTTNPSNLFNVKRINVNK